MGERDEGKGGEGEREARASKGRGVRGRPGGLCTCFETRAARVRIGSKSFAFLSTIAWECCCAGRGLCVWKCVAVCGCVWLC